MRPSRTRAPRIALPRPWATYTLILLNVLDFAWVYVTGGFDSDYSLIAHGALRGELVRHGDWWRIVTGQFEHAGWLHILSNMWALYAVGSFVEIAAGRRRMLLL